MTAEPNTTSKRDELDVLEAELASMAPRLHDQERRLKFDLGYYALEPAELERLRPEVRRLNRYGVMPDALHIARFLNDRGAHFGRLHVEQLADEVIELKSSLPALELAPRTFVMMARASTSLLHPYQDELTREFAPTEVESAAPEAPAADDGGDGHGEVGEPTIAEVVAQTIAKTRPTPKGPRSDAYYADLVSKAMDIVDERRWPKDEDHLLQALAKVRGKTKPMSAANWRKWLKKRPAVVTVMKGRPIFADLVRYRDSS